MGNEGSVPTFYAEPVFAPDGYFAVSDNAAVQQKINHAIQAKAIEVEKKSESKAKVKNMPYNGRWSMLKTKGEKPEPRIKQNYVYDRQENSIVVAYGKGKRNQDFNDFWRINLKTHEWSYFGESTFSPRHGTCSMKIARHMVFFGGKHEGKYFADLHALNLDNGEILDFSQYPKGPSPRSHVVMFCSATSVFIWGGHDETKVYNDMYEFNIISREWTYIAKTKYAPRKYPTYCSNEDKTYQFVFGSSESKESALLQFDPEAKKLIEVTDGTHGPATKLRNCSIACANDHLFVLGGTDPEKPEPYTLVYTFNIPFKKWSTFYVKPDNKTVTAKDGFVNPSGLFLLPNVPYQSVVYSSKDHCLYGVFGKMFLSKCPLQRIALGDAMSTLNHRNDMLEMFAFSAQ